MNEINGIGDRGFEKSSAHDLSRRGILTVLLQTRRSRQAWHLHQPADEEIKPANNQREVVRVRYTLL